MAIKITSYVELSEEAKAEDPFYAEINCLKELDHPNICKLHGHNGQAVATTAEGKKVEVSYMALDYAQEGELFDWVSLLITLNYSSIRI